MSRLTRLGLAGYTSDIAPFSVARDLIALPSVNRVTLKGIFSGLAAFKLILLVPALRALDLVNVNILITTRILRISGCRQAREPTLRNFSHSPSHLRSQSFFSMSTRQSTSAACSASKSMAQTLLHLRFCPPAGPSRNYGLVQVRTVNQLILLRTSFDPTLTLRSSLQTPDRPL